MRVTWRLRPEGSWSARATRFEAAVERQLALGLWRRGWRPQVLGYTGYGSSEPDHGWVRLLGRVVLRPPAVAGERRSDVRGWRHFLAVSLPGVDVVAEVGAERHALRSAHGGYFDVVVPSGLPAGWATIPIAGPTTHQAVARARIVGPDETRGVISDIDDTVMVTAIPRPLLAFWNSFVRLESSRHPVPGMPKLFARLTRQRPGHPPAQPPFVVYLSTGAWNVAPSIRHFLHRHDYPDGPLLMTDWGPTPDRWFRSGRGHKRAALRRLLIELPQLRWTLVGDDGQHDPVLYDELVADAPGRVELIAIRELSVAEQVLTHGTPGPLPETAATNPPQGDDGVLRVRAPDGIGLLARLDALGLREAPDGSGRHRSRA